MYLFDEGTGIHVLLEMPKELAEPFGCLLLSW